MALSDEVKASVSLHAVVDPLVIWDRTKSNPTQGDWWAPCPLHAEDTASFHLTEKGGVGGVFHCFGCHAKGSVIDFIMARDGLSFPEATRALASEAGVDLRPDPARQRELDRQRAERRQREERETAQKAARGHAKAQAIWREAKVNHPALVAYLEGRGIRLDAIGGVPATLRWHPDLPCYTKGEDGQTALLHRGPAMVAFVGRDKLVGIHRTWVNPTDPAQGRAIANHAKVPKQMLGRAGQMYGQPIVLSKPGNRTLLVGEGIETTLAALAQARLSGLTAVGAECAGSLTALAGPGCNRGKAFAKCPRTRKPLPTPKPLSDTEKPGWLPPAGTDRTVILADPSAKSPDAAQRYGERAQAKIAPRCPHGARLAIPRGHWDHDDDFADLAKSGELYAPTKEGTDA
ncbi:MAG: CHC2 zinc finger domain-containing protein [Pseudomonadota bacterium]